MGETSKNPHLLEAEEELMKQEQQNSVFVFFLFPPPQVILMSLILIEKNLQLAKSSSLQPAYIPSFQETSRVSLLMTTFCSWPSSIYICERW